MMIEICEIFYSLQGESSYSGKPCIFIRLSGCNLRCSYCDTQYSYAPGTMMSIESILQTISEFPARLVELTGGEPLWQEESIALMEAPATAGLYCAAGNQWFPFGSEDVPQAVGQDPGCKNSRQRLW
jgi:7-carboxy-7-deazaguanine synthase